MRAKCLLTPALSLVIFLASGLFASELSSKAARRLDPRLHALLRESDLQKGVLLSRAALARNANERFVSVLIKTELSRESLRQKGVRVLGKIGDIYTAVVRIERLAHVAESDSVVYIEASKSFKLQNDVAAEATGISTVRQQSNLTGQGVIVGVIDSGIDWRHADFRNSDGATRIRFILDFSDPGDTNNDGVLDGAGPFGGTLYNEAQINDALSGVGSVAESDRNGHGSHVVGTAAGNGFGTGAGILSGTYAGMAPEADIIFVKGRNGDSGGIPGIDIINALQFVDSVAAVSNQPYVVNVSAGTHDGAHDGTSLQEQAIDNLVGAGRAGKVVVASAGNDGDVNIHAGGSVTGATITLEFEISAFTANPGTRNDFVIFDGWYNGADDLSFTLVSPTDASYGPVSSGSRLGRDTPNGAVIIENAQAGANPLNGDKEVIIQIFDNSSNLPAAGTWQLQISGNTFRYDLWLVLSSMEAELQSNIDHSRTVEIPGTAKNVITVGAWVSKKRWTDLDGNNLSIPPLVVGELADFSSIGPSRDRRIKPEITAPGQMIASTLSASAPPDGQFSIWNGTSDFPNAFILSDNFHAIGSGTSFAAPIIAGGIALMLQRDPNLDSEQIRNILISTATADEFTGSVPNDKWGFGKVDFVAALDAVVSVDSRKHAAGIPQHFRLSPNFPNPFSAKELGTVRNHGTTFEFHLPRAAHVKISVFDVLGQKVRELIDSKYAGGSYRANWDGRNQRGEKMAAGIYLYKMTAGDFVASRKMLLMR